MIRQVEIRGFGQRIDNPPGESLLESALSAGLPVDYGCSNGNCGKCRARLVEGDIKRIAYSDFAFRQSEVDDGWFLMCCHSAASDLLIDAPLASGAEDIPVQEIEVRVRKVLPLDDEYTLLHVQTPRTRRLRFLAGQSARLSDAVASCTLPIATCPCDDRNIHFHVPSDPEMCSAAERLTSLKTGDALTLTGPEGGFVLDAESDRPRLMIGAAAGLAPLKSIVEHSLALTPAIPVSLLLVETGTGPHCLHNLFRSWRDAMDNFSYECCDSGTGSASEAMRAFLAAVADESFDVYVSGPEDVIDSARGVLTELDVPDERIHVNIV